MKSQKWPFNFQETSAYCKRQSKWEHEKDIVGKGEDK
jgi:hypothetical protein